MVYVYLLYQNSELVAEVKDIGMQSHDDILNWGRNYINFNFTATKDNVITYEVFDDEAEESIESNYRADNTTETADNLETSRGSVDQDGEQGRR